MNTEQLKYLIAVSKSGSITQASKELHLTPAALSIGLKKLETELNTTLLNRVSKGIQITEEGYALIKASESFFRKVDAITNKNILPIYDDSPVSVNYMVSYGLLNTFFNNV